MWMETAVCLVAAGLFVHLLVKIILHACKSRSSCSLFERKSNKVSDIQLNQKSNSEQLKQPPRLESLQIELEVYLPVPPKPLEKPRMKLPTKAL